MKTASKSAKPPTSKSPTPNKRILIRLPEDYLPYKLLIGEAIYLYLWCIYRTTAEYAAGAHGRRIGLVLGGAPKKDSEIAGELGCSTKTVQRWRKKLEEYDLIHTKQVGRGTMYAVTDSYKFKAEHVRPNPPEWTQVSTIKK